MKFILSILLLVSIGFAGERSVSTIGDIIIDIDYELTKDNRAFYIKLACGQPFKEQKNIDYCVQIVTLDMSTKSGLSQQYYSDNKQKIITSSSRKENYQPVR